MTENELSTRNPNLELRPIAHEPEPGDPFVGPRPDSWWTGPAPSRDACPGVDANGVLRSLRTPDLARCERSDVLAYFDNTWCLTEVLFSSLQGRRAFLALPWHRLRHPMVFYYCHPATFYVNKLRLAGLVESIDPGLETLFQTGVDEMSWDDLSHSELDWPPLEHVLEYRREAYRRVRRVIEEHPDLREGHGPITRESPLWALFMALEHERIHLELSSVLIRELPVEWVARPAEWPPLHPSAAERPHATQPEVERDFPVNTFVEIGSGQADVGKPERWPSYGWDNEYGARGAHVSPFRVQRMLVSNGEFHAFVRDEGYLDRTLWSRDGWGWRQFRNAKWPTFWVSAGPAGLHEYRLRTLFEIVDMPWSWPVEVNYHEAQAYRAWRERREGRRYRLLSEAKHHRLRRAPAPTPDGHPERAARDYDLALAHGSPGPVNAFAASEHGVHDVFGNVWQWCEDHFHPLDGFRVHPLYDDFSTPCFDGKHQLILGGSFVSTGAEASVWARFHFRPHFFHHAGIRLVEAAQEGADDAVRLEDLRTSVDTYEGDAAFEQYMLLHYGRPEDALPFEGGPRQALEFPQRCARALTELATAHGVGLARALDVGCAVGGASFELARSFGEVVGVDRSERFVAAAQALADEGRLAHFRRDEGELGSEVVATIDPSVDRERVRFRVADACALPVDLLGFDAVLAANLLDRLPSPRAFLERLGGPRGLVRPGGVLILTSPYTWSEQFTPRDAWLGGMRSGEQERWSIDGLRAAIEGDFELIQQRDEPLLIREHRRKYQYVVAHLTAWRRRDTSP